MISEETTNSSDKDLWKGLKVSLGLHVAIFLIFTVKTMFFNEPVIDYSSAIRVDMVALPDKLSENQLPPKAQEPPAEEKPAPKTKPVEAAKPKADPKVVKAPKAPTKDLEAINLGKEKNKQKEALEKLKAMSALDKIKDQIENENKKVAGVGAKPAPPVKYKGNVLAAGTELTGLNKLQHDNYLSNLDHQIKQNWFLPEWLSKKSLRAQVRMKLDEKGQLISRDLVLSSGNSSYDELALETIDKSAPFPPPPEKFVSIVAVTGLVIGFPE